MQLGKLYVDDENMSFLVGVDMEAPSLGKIKMVTLGSFGRYALVRIQFCCIYSDWDQFERDCGQILNSFQFDTSTDYKGSQKKDGFFGEDILVDVGVYGTIAIVIFLIGLVGRLYKSKVKNESKDVQNNS